MGNQRAWKKASQLHPDHCCRSTYIVHVHANQEGDHKCYLDSQVLELAEAVLYVTTDSESERSTRRPPLAPLKPPHRGAMIVPRNSAFAEERAEVELLLAQAEKQKDFNKRLEASVARVEDIARRLDEAMGPVYNDTQSLSVVTNSEMYLLRQALRY